MNEKRQACARIANVIESYEALALCAAAFGRAYRRWHDGLCRDDPAGLGVAEATPDFLFQSFVTELSLSPSEKQIMGNSTDKVDNARRLMSALVRQKPKPHEEMKLGKARLTEKQRQDRLAKIIDSDDPENADEIADLLGQKGEPGS